ncbi:hypothetical protein [Sphingomonas rhizophila]|uniref:hypothetical protein n=1 Tax=Sphingomonas rhizophila TaxID=2071607 RepID=UPI001FE74018|nr:hypothetical protein [Sphingomonas rhizophila]
MRAADNESLARQAGADVVVNPVSFAGLLLARSSEGTHVADYIADLVTTEGDVSIRERLVAPHEVGRSLQDVCDGQGVRIHRGTLHFSPWDREAAELKAGDLIIEVVPTLPKAAANL